MMEASGEEKEVARVEYARDGPEARRIARTIPYYPFKGIDRFYDIGGEANKRRGCHVSWRLQRWPRTCVVAGG